MRLPPMIERELQIIEASVNRGGGQHAGTFRLNDLRWAIEQELKALARGHSADDVCHHPDCMLTREHTRGYCGY